MLEPRAAGRFAGNNVTLGKREIDIIEKTYLDYNTLKSLEDYPIINYLGYHQRRVGCFGGGNRFLYIDTDGDAHICPYCRGKIANALTKTADEIIGLTIKQPCHVFQNNVNF